MLVLIRALLLTGCASELSRADGDGTSPTASSALPSVTPELGGAWLLKVLEGEAVSVAAERGRPTVVFDVEKKRV